MLRGYVTNLGKYNEGQLVGMWIDFPVQEDEFNEALEKIGINEEYEEFFFTDWEADFDHGLGEYVNIEEVNELAEAIEGVDGNLIAAILEAMGGDLMDALEYADNYMLYEGMELIDLAYQFVEELYDLPEFALRYFDYEAFARDLSFDDYWETTYGVLARA
jgi:antirestriction protein